MSTVNLDRDFAIDTLAMLARDINEMDAARWIHDGEGSMARDSQVEGPWGEYIKAVLSFGQAIGLTEREIVAARFGQLVRNMDTIKSDAEHHIFWEDSKLANCVYCWDLTDGSGDHNRLAVHKNGGTALGTTPETPVEPCLGPVDVAVHMLQWVSILRRQPVYMTWQGELYKVTANDARRVNPSNPRRKNYPRQFRSE